MSSAPCLCSVSDKDAVRNMILEAGACAVGFAESAPADLELYDRWIEAGMHGTLDYMARYRNLRLDPSGLLDGCRTVISIAFAYYYKGQPRSAFFADYALGSDYHDVLRQRLAPVCDVLRALVPGSATRICVDSAPIPERAWAVRAGIGFIGCNRQLIVPGVGSKVFLCEILWTAATVPDSPCTGSCAACGACLSACPAGALDEEGVDARRCLSALSIEHKGQLPAGTRFPDRICGCDICQDVCPHNAAPAAEVIEEFRPRASILALDAGAIATLDAPTFSATFSHNPVKRLKLANLLRNLSHRR